MPSSIPDGAEAAILKSLIQTHSASETGRLFGVSKHAVLRLANKAKRPDFIPDAVKLQPPVDPLEAAEAKRTRERELSRERDLLRDVAGERSFRAFLEALFKDGIDALEAPPKYKAPVGRRAGKPASERFPLLHLSDFHFEEVVKSAGVMGLNSYDIPTACRRAWRVVHAFLDWHKDLLASGRFVTPELVVALNGDFLSGTLHGLEKHSSAPNVIRATLACGRLLGLILRDLSAAFPVVRVAAVSGNHGRLPDDRKTPTKDPTRSFDYMAYAIARELVRECKNVTIELPDSYGVIMSVGGHNCYFGHGNFIQQSLGVVGYGMRRFVSNLAANLSAAGQPLKYAFFGHFHAINSGEFAGLTAFIGPSLIGTQEYGFLANGSVSRSAQQAFIFDRQLGHVETQNLYGEGPHYDGTYEIEV